MLDCPDNEEGEADDFEGTLLVAVLVWDMYGAAVEAGTS